MSVETNSSNGDLIPDVVVRNSDTGVYKIGCPLQNDDSSPYKRLSRSMKVDSNSDLESSQQTGEARGFTKSENDVTDIEAQKIHQNYLVCIARYDIFQMCQPLYLRLCDIDVELQEFSS